jgi:hypothetical protein
MATEALIVGPQVTLRPAYVPDLDDLEGTYLITDIDSPLQRG